MTPVVGIAACAKLVDGYMRHDTPARYAAAVLGGAGALPVMIPPMGEAQLDVLDRLDGLLVPGSPSNVHPDHYGGGESRTPDRHDLDRDATTLRLIPAAIERAMPVLAICRGIQELNVALGGTLHQVVHEVPGRHDHRGGPGTIEMRYSPSHLVTLSGELARIVGAPTIMVNSVHGQAIDSVAPGLDIEAVAPDGTIEAVRLHSPDPGRVPGGLVPGRLASGSEPWVFGVQWHPEWRYADDSASLAIFRAFGKACREYHAKSGKWG
jgi:putative glutamine amidotransferase